MLLSKKTFALMETLWAKGDLLPTDLLIAREGIYKACHFSFDKFFKEEESLDYGACVFELNHLSVKFRVAKITPTKPGQFVTFWKRNEQGITQPYHDADNIDFFVISTRKDNQLGQFIFPKKILSRQHIISTSEKEGKHGFRVYPPWDKTTNKQAQRSQHWQLDFFLELNESSQSIERAKLLYLQNV